MAAEPQKPADPKAIKFGLGGARSNTIENLKQRQDKIEKIRKKSFFREQIIFFVIAAVSITPWVLAFSSHDSKTGYMLFKLGGIMLVGLYPTYLLLRFAVSLMTKPKTTEVKPKAKAAA